MTQKTKDLSALVFFILLVMGGGIFIGTQTLPGDWFAGLTKPSFNPPNWIFAPVWTVLYLFIAIAGWRSWRQGWTRTPMQLWFVQLVLNFAWSPLFFTAHRTDLALAVIVLLLVSILIFITKTWRLDRISAGLFVPYAAWVGFATLLNGAIFALNG
ncbi:TspO/MBR family protein [Cohaesibacter celericrescens]|uniref:Sensor histidine kinase n=1 Tax=Cohaesibacter celericrescens TaxID=2067669 RepID=A0A2N5XUX8_9HYPH|nr:TspO/MBR family protein [Cohaesibacter celericrescens]PLW78228.1 sensor histidine kinase [Cohaesibacter celericrescens]